MQYLWYIEIKLLSTLCKISDIPLLLRLHPIVVEEIPVNFI